MSRQLTAASVSGGKPVTIGASKKAHGSQARLSSAIDLTVIDLPRKGNVLCSAISLTVASAAETSQPRVITLAHDLLGSRGERSGPFHARIARFTQRCATVFASLPTGALRLRPLEAQSSAPYIKVVV